MSRFEALFKAPKRPEDMASPGEAVGESRPSDSPERELEDNVFSLTPPERALDLTDTVRDAVETPPTEPAADAPKKTGRNVQPLATADLSRLSIDNDGRLYWDGKPVEVRRRIQMSQAQVLGASVVGIFVVIGSIGAAVQGSLALRDWGCRLGWTANYCSLPSVQPRRPDIPA